MKCPFEYVYSWCADDHYIKAYRWYKLPRTTGFSVLLMCGGAYVASVLFDMNDYDRIR